MTPTKITDSASIGGSCTVQYPTRSPFNSDGTRLLLLEPHNFGLYDVAALKRIGPLEWLGDSANEPLWSRKTPSIFYYHTVNFLCAFDIVTNLKWTVRVFPEYQIINFGNGEGDISEDGDHIAVVGTKPDSSRESFVYQISTDQKGPIVSIDPGLDSVYLTPNSNLLISYPSGIFLCDTSSGEIRQITTRNGHKAVTRDADGSECMVWLDDTDNFVKKIRLSDGQRTPLVGFDWSLAVHITCQRKGPFCIAETYDPKNPTSTVQYANAILKVPLDGSPVTELLKHGSNSASYDGQPRCSISGDGGRFVYGSNQGGAFTDVYLCALDIPVPTHPGPAPISAVVPAPIPQSAGINSQMIYADARGGGKLSVATFVNGLLVENVNLE